MSYGRRSGAPPASAKRFRSGNRPRVRDRGADCIPGLALILRPPLPGGIRATPRTRSRLAGSFRRGLSPEVLRRGSIAGAFFAAFFADDDAFAGLGPRGRGLAAARSSWPLGPGLRRSHWLRLASRSTALVGPGSFPCSSLGTLATTSGGPRATTPSTPSPPLADFYHAILRSDHSRFCSMPTRCSLLSTMAFASLHEVRTSSKWRPLV